MSNAFAESSASRRWLLPFALAWSTLVLLTGVVLTGPTAALAPLYGLADPRVGPAGLGAFIGHAILCGSDLRRKRVLRAGLVLEILRIVIVVRSGVPIDSAVLSTGYGFLAAALADFLIHREWRFAGLAVLVPVGMANAQLGLSSLVRRVTPLTYDGALYALDLALRVPFSRLTGEMFSRVPLVSLASLIAYAALPGTIAAGLAYEEYNARRSVRRGVGVNLLLAYTVSGSIAAILYWLCPGTGPAHAFDTAFPQNLPSIDSVGLSLASYAPFAPRNAMPSLHVAWAIMLARSTAGARASVRYTAIGLALLTTLATIGSGEHYLIDLVAAVPFLVALEAATAHRFIPLRLRTAPFIIGLLLYGGWVWAARHATAAVPFLFAHPAIMWVLVAATLVISTAVALRPLASLGQSHFAMPQKTKAGDAVASPAPF